jgi:hypothetical protein
VTVLVDEARWSWRDRRWAHLVSDLSLTELHDFADRLGLRRVAFQGDHYDVDALHRERALVLGAEPVPARELVRRLRAAGLRLPPSRRPGPWRAVLVAGWPLHPAERQALDVHPALLDCLDGVPLPGASTTVLERAGDLAALIRVPGDVTAPLPDAVRRTRDGADTVLEVLSPAEAGR